MAKKNDALVGQLLKKVEEKKTQIKKIKNPDFTTNLSFPTGVLGTNSRVNLNVAAEEDLVSILVFLDSMMEKGKHLAEVHEVDYNNHWHGFKLGDWYRDVVLKIKQKQSQKQVQELRTIEKKLEGLMSEDKRTNIELEKLGNLLGN